MTDFRVLCARMADELDYYRQLLMDNRRETHALATEARALLAQPEPVVLSDEELLETMSQAMREDFAQVSRLSAQQAGVPAGVYRTTLNVRALEFARAVLAKWGANAQ